MTISSSIWFKIWKNLDEAVQSIENLTIEEFRTINTITSLAYHLDSTATNKNYQFLPNIKIDKLLNKMMIFVLNQIDYFTIESLLSTCGNLVCLKESSSYLINDTRTLIAILSLPWMDISNNMFNSLPLYIQLNGIVKKYSTLLSKSSL